MTLPQICPDTKVVAVRETFFSNRAGEAVILNLKSGVYYALNEVGAKIWSLIQEPKTVNELEKYILEENYLELNLSTLLDQLSEQGLIKICYKSNS